METFKAILTWLFVNWLWDFIKFLFWGVILWWLWFLVYQSYNKNIKIWDKAKIKNSFKSKINQNIEIWEWVEVDDSFKS